MCVCVCFFVCFFFLFFFFFLGGGGGGIIILSLAITVFCTLSFWQHYGKNYDHFYVGIWGGGKFVTLEYGASSQI